MKRDIQIYCAQCSRCAARKAPSSTAKAELMSMGAGFQFERIAMDHSQKQSVETGIFTSLSIIIHVGLRRMLSSIRMLIQLQANW